MSVSQMWAEDRLDGASNWSPWKNRIIFVLEDLELWDIVQALVVIPPAPAPSPLLDANFRKKNTKAKRTICDVVRDHVIPHLTGKDYAFEMWASLCKLYQSPNQNSKDGSAGEAQEHSDAQFRVGDIIPWDIYTDSR
jgi:hypothetical protein